VDTARIAEMHPIHRELVIPVRVAEVIPVKASLVQTVVIVNMIPFDSSDHIAVSIILVAHILLPLTLIHAVMLQAHEYGFAIGSFRALTASRFY
jgi:hypothetical protein